MAIDEKLLDKAWRNPADLRFAEAYDLAIQLGWEEPRRRGSHVIFFHPEGAKIRKNFPQPLNLQEGKNGKAKEYQVKQMLKMATELGVIPAKASSD
jgi:HicA toxin of bacterial toxin-antitoxin,